MTERDHDDDAVWRAIVENYGERPRLEPPASAEPEHPAVRDDEADHLADDRAHDRADDDVLWAEERFVPPEPPPLPQPPPARLAAWLGVLGTPAVLFGAALAGVSLPAWLGYLMVVAFLGGFGYLVLHMRRGPRDPWDDGAQV